MTPSDLARFLFAVGGNWRNAIYIGCRTPGCTRRCCSGILFAADRDGTPILIPAETYQLLSGQQIDRFECVAQLDRDAFASAYRKYLDWQTETDGDCIIWHVLSDQ